MGLTSAGKHASVFANADLRDPPTEPNCLGTALFLTAAALRGGSRPQVESSRHPKWVWRSAAQRQARRAAGPSRSVPSAARGARPPRPPASASQPKSPAPLPVHPKPVPAALATQPVAAAPSPPREGGMATASGVSAGSVLQLPSLRVGGRLRCLAYMLIVRECVLLPPLLQCATHARSNSSDALTWLWLLMFRCPPRDRCCLGEQPLELPQVRFCSRYC